MDYDLIVVKTLERVYKNYYYIIRGKEYIDRRNYGRFIAYLNAFSKMNKDFFYDIIEGDVTLSLIHI